MMWKGFLNVLIVYEISTIFVQIITEIIKFQKEQHNQYVQMTVLNKKRNMISLLLLMMVMFYTGVKRQNE